MKKIVVSLLFYTTHFFGQYTMIPDPIFEQNLINQQIDSNTTIDGQVLTSAIATVTQLGLGSTNGGLNSVTNLQGIEGFTVLQVLTLAGNDSLQNLNINNSTLKELYCYGNILINVYINAPMLEILIIENPIPIMQTLNVTNCSMLKNLFCANNALTVLDISNNAELEILSAYNNSLTQLIIGNNPKLITIQCLNNLITTLNLTNCTQLTNLYISQNNLTSLNLSQNPLLKILSCSNNNLTSLDLTNCTQLTHLYLFYNNLATINVSQNIVLKVLECSANNLSSLDVSQNTALQSLGCAINNLSSIDVSQNNLLQRLGCSNNNITSLNMQNNSQLQFLWCSANNLIELNLQNGSNSLLNGTFTSGQITYTRFNATNNPNLKCILVDDVANCQANWVGVDPTSNFVASQAACDNLLSNPSFNDNELVVYPNPVSDILTINNNNFEIFNISVYNMIGEKILDLETNKNQVDVSKLVSGIYMVSITANNKTFSTKIVKK